MHHCFPSMLTIIFVISFLPGAVLGLPELRVRPGSSLVLMLRPNTRDLTFPWDRRPFHRAMKFPEGSQGEDLGCNPPSSPAPLLPLLLAGGCLLGEMQVEEEVTEQRK